MYTVTTRTTVSIRNAWNIRDLNDVACSAKNAVCERSSRSRRRRIMHGCKSSPSLLAGDVVVLPFLLQLRILLLSPLLDPKPINQKHSKSNKRHSSYHSTSDCSYVRSARWRRWARVCNTSHVGAGVSVLRHQRADLFARACRARGSFWRALYAALEDGSECALDIYNSVSPNAARESGPGRLTRRHGAPRGGGRLVALDQPRRP